MELESRPGLAGRGMKRTPTSQPSAERAMGNAELESWLRARRARNPLVRTLPMLEGFVTAMAAGPLDLDIIGQICAALAVERSAFEAGGTKEFSAIKAMADRFNAVGAALSNGRLEPRHQRKPNGSVDASEWCEGFLAAVNLHPKAWKDVLDPNSPLNGLMLPIMLHCKNSFGQPMLGQPRPGAETQSFIKRAYTDIPVHVCAIRDHYHVRRYDQPQTGIPHH